MELYVVHAVVAWALHDEKRAESAGLLCLACSLLSYVKVSPVCSLPTLARGADSCCSIHNMQQAARLRHSLYNGITVLLTFLMFWLFFNEVHTAIYIDLYREILLHSFLVFSWCRFVVALRRMCDGFV